MGFCLFRGRLREQRELLTWSRVYRLAAAAGASRELTASEVLHERINGSRRRWRAVQRTAHHRNSQEQTPEALPDGAAPPAPATPGG